MTLCVPLLLIALSLSCCSVDSKHQLSPEPTRVSTLVPVAHNPRLGEQSPQGSATMPMQWKFRDPAEVAPGSEVEIRSAIDPKINGKYQVSFDNRLLLPYDVVITTNGLTTEQLQTALNKEYRRFYTKPDLRVTVSNAKRFLDVQGLVKKPGHYLVRENASLDEVISAAEGLLAGVDQRPRAQYARIEQLGISATVRLQDYYSGNTGLVPQWQGGEVIFFQSEGGAATNVTGGYVQMLGQVKSPGEYPYDHESDFVQYLIRAGGPTELADLTNITLFRERNSTRQKLTFNMDEVDAIPAINAGDTVMIYADNPSKVEKQSRVLGGFATVISAIGTLALLFLTI